MQVWPDGPVFGRKFDLSEFAWLFGAPPPCSLYGSWNIPTDDYPYGQNDPGYSNSAYDTACLQAMGSITEADRQVNYEETVKIFTQELPVLPLFIRMKWGMTAPHLTGFSLDPTENTFWNIEETSIGIQGIIPPGGGEFPVRLQITQAITISHQVPSPDTVVITHTTLSPVVLPEFGGLSGAGHFFRLEADLDGQPVQPSQPFTMTIVYSDAELGIAMEG